MLGRNFSLHKFRCLSHVHVFRLQQQSRLCLHALGHKVDPPHVVRVGVVRQRLHGGLQVGVGDCHPLDGVPGTALLHLDDLPVPGELVGDLPDPGHAGVGEVEGEVTVTVGHNPHGGGGAQGGVLQHGRQGGKGTGPLTGLLLFCLNKF